MTLFTAAGSVIAGLNFLGGSCKPPSAVSREAASGAVPGRAAAGSGAVAGRASARGNEFVAVPGRTGSGFAVPGRAVICSCVVVREPPRFSRFR